MSGCTCENWTLQDLSSALQDMHKDNKRIVVPMFQRGKRWKKEQEQKFIDSLVKGYPVGTMLFYETFEDGKRTYILVDGLQRGNSIKKYMTNPTEFFYDDSISDDFCDSILSIVHKENDKRLYGKVRNILTSFIKEQKTFKNLQYYPVAKRLVEAFSPGSDLIQELINVISIFFEERQDLYDKISSTIIPVIVYTGDEDNLPDIFDRINSQGTALDQYEVYAAAWPVKRKFVISNADIIEYVIRKYDTFEEDNFKIHGYNREEMRTQKTVNAFEYLFGLGKYLTKKYDILAFKKNLAEDAVNPLAFELVNACLNETDKIKTLYENVYEIDVNAFETALYRAIEFVNDSIGAITKFKGNSRNTNKIFHSKYQILSMISAVFKGMYDGVDFTKCTEAWQENKYNMAKNLLQYYVYDIITNYWSEGVVAKLLNASKSRRYMTEISGRAWMVALDAFLERSMSRAEVKKIANPAGGEYVILNCIYVKTFTAMDQLSKARFDVEHIAPKEQMRNLIATCNGSGLPVSCIANLCYLPEQVNRSKKAKNFYQDKKYLENIKLEEIEEKYSFTEREDLEWMDMPYGKEDFAVLKDYYTDYCTKRFDKMKRLFCKSLGIEYEAIQDEESIGSNQKVVIPTVEGKLGKNAELTDRCILRLANIEKAPLIQVGRSSYVTKDYQKGFVITASKAYKQESRDKFWFAYRKNRLKDIENCKEKYVVYCCKDESTIICLPVDVIEQQLVHLNASFNDEGEVSHWHMVFLKYTNGTVKWMLSKPKIEEIGVDKYLI